MRHAFTIVCCCVFADFTFGRLLDHHLLRINGTGHGTPRLLVKRRVSAVNEELDIPKAWIIAAVVAMVYVLAAMAVNAFVYVLSRKQRQRNYDLAKAEQGGLISKRELATARSTKKSAGRRSAFGSKRGPKEALNSQQSYFVPPSLISPEEPNKDFGVPKRVRYFDEDLTQEETVNSVRVSSDDKVFTALGASSISEIDTALDSGPIEAHPLRPLSPPSSYSGTETVPRTTASEARMGSALLALQQPADEPEIYAELPEVAPQSARGSSKSSSSGDSSTTLATGDATSSSSEGEGTSSSSYTGTTETSSSSTLTGDEESDFSTSGTESSDDNA